MKTFNAARLQVCIDELHGVASSAEYLRDMSGGGGDSDPKFLKRAQAAVEDAKQVAHPLSSDALLIATRARNTLNYKADYSAINSEVTHVADALSDALGKHAFLIVAESRKQYIDNPNFLGRQVVEAFPKAQPDIVEAGNCLAAECGTAAVFHLMRVVEWGLRGLCADLGLLRVKRKNGSIPSSHADWETLLNQLNPRVDAKIEAMKRGTAKQNAQQFYYPMLQDIRGIRDAWRNHIMHSRDRFYSPQDAEVIAGHVGRIMQALANK